MEWKGEGANVIVVCDTRERLPLVFPTLKSVRKTLQSSDYSILGLELEFGIERKEKNDFVSCTFGENKERFYRELHRLRGFSFARIIIECSREDIAAHKYVSQVNPATVLGVASVCEMRFGIPVCWVGTREAGALLIEEWARQYYKEKLRMLKELLKVQEETQPPF